LLITSQDTTTAYPNNKPLPASAPSIPCSDSDRCHTGGVLLSPPRRSDPAISRFCPTLGWLHLVKNVNHRSAVNVALASDIVLNVPDMWSRDDDNLLLQTIANTIRLNTDNPDCFLKSGYRGDSGPPVASMPRELHVLFFLA